MLMLTKHSLDLRLAKDLELGNEAREPHRPSMDGVVSFPEGTKAEEKVTRADNEVTFHPRVYRKSRQHPRSASRRSSGSQSSG